MDDLEDVENEILIDLNQRRPDVFDVYRLNVTTGEMQMVAENPGNYVGYLTDHEGKVRVAMAKEAEQNLNVLLYRETEEQEFRPILTTGFKDQVSPYFFSADNRQLYATSNIGRDRKALVLMDPATGKEKVAEVAIKYGDFIQTCIDFLLIAFVIFLFVKAYHRARKPAPDAAPSEEVLLLREIRDELKK